jgi:23S rRNA pseudouridine2605 synthase
MWLPTKLPSNRKNPHRYPKAKMPSERLQKIIAAAGIASRRKAEELITQGLVSVNGQVITELGAKADATVDHIKVHGKLLQGAQRHATFLLHKPKGYVTTSVDPEGRPTVIDLMKEPGLRLYPVGRLDYASEGLLLMTNDGELANLLTKASSHVPKTYLVKVSGSPTEEALQKLRDGVRIPEGEGKAGKYIKTSPARVSWYKRGENPWFEVTLIQGRNRQIRKMFEVVGHRVEKIKRVTYGPLQLDVEAGKYRALTLREVALLKASVRKKQARQPAE